MGTWLGAAKLRDEIPSKGQLSLLILVGGML